MPSHSYFGSGGKPRRSGGLPHSSLLLRHWLGEHWGWKGPGAAGLLGTFLRVQSTVLLPAAFHNPDSLAAAQSPSSPTFWLLLLLLHIPSPLKRRLLESRYFLPAWISISSLSCRAGKMQKDAASILREFKHQEASEETQARRILSGVHGFALQPHLTLPGAHGRPGLPVPPRAASPAPALPGRARQPPW